MTRAGRRRLVKAGASSSRRAIGGLLVLVGAASPARGEVPEPGNPWEARDHLVRSGSAPAHPGLRVALGLTTWEALDGDLATNLCLAQEPESGPGWAVGWHRYWLAENQNADDAEARVVFRTVSWRASVGAGVLRQGSHRLSRGLVTGHAQVLDVVLAGARVAVYPGEESWAPEVVAGLHVAHGSWWGGLELGPNSGELRVSVGVKASPRLVWTSSWSGTHPEVGLAWGMGGMQVRAHRAPHPRLGDVQHLHLVAGGLVP